MKVLVTGANGFVGSHIVEALIAKGHEVVCQVRKTSNLKWLKGCPAELKTTDVLDEHMLPELVKGVDAIVHNAAILRAKTTEAYYKTNQIATRNLLNAVLKYNPGLKKFIFISSQAAMGPCEGLEPKKIGSNENPVSDYGRSKLSAERELKVLEGKIPYTIFRPASVYGPRDKDLFIFFQVVNLGLKPATLKKKYIQLLFVGDLARAVEASLNHEKTNYKTYFLSDPKPYLWKEVGEVISEAMNKKTLELPVPDFLLKIAAFFSEAAALFSGRAAVLNFQKIDELKQCYWVADSTDIVKDTGMDFTNLKIGAKITYDWYKKNGWLK